MQDIDVIDHLSIPPDSGKITDALARIGYKLEEAVADIADNSLDASASNILIRIVHDGSDIRRIVIADDGYGMSRDALIAAMKFGSSRNRSETELGKFGMGLKTAAFSQGRSLSVISRQSKVTNACRWTAASISQGWQCDILDPEQAALRFDAVEGPFTIGDSGTLIIIDELDHLRVSNKGLEATLQKIQKALSVHLGLTFHRFLANGSQIFTDAVLDKNGHGGFSVPIQPLNPFSYQISADREYPLEFSIDLSDLPPLKCKAHIWPANQTSPGYMLGGGNVAKRQGFYFYRNNRLIQAGGWNGWRLADTEPHMSLARVQIELQPEFDTYFRLNVQKSSVDVPEGFRAALDNHQNPMGRFVRRADEIYRKKTIVEQNFIPVPGRGFDREIRKRAASYLAGRKLPTQEIDIVWKRLQEDRFFEIDRTTGCVYLNSIYRQDILKGLPASLNDAPMIKTLLFLLLRDSLMRERESRQFTERLEQFNELLMLALAEERERK
ncbi:ATP-binding protein [Burkholderia lata]|uniref:ATP-binding protein n=1 Tax=Burkholderia lata (strain ATCC 17760 / DSM 23089 / LMG 22485 / NCIMB 9086 / R18194 / 383) TaxID=482957 RepID=UPI001581E6FB|nr:ATP-binding protein [Burkholderia lata]